ncbi:MAG TPA: ATP-binding protein [Candidatus Thermoplasmatota archaeon]|nr:ATP-binding protein [Candidatus Thermoplasmatota archaeon]
MKPEVEVTIRGDSDVVAARQAGRSLAAELPFTSTELTFIATAISEVARNILQYAGTGTVWCRLVENGDRSGIEVEAVDRGPGIVDTEQALKPGFSTGGSLGLGLSGAKNLMDEFTLWSQVGEGTRVTMRKWARRSTLAERARELI